MKFYSLSTSGLAAALLAGVTHAGFPDEGDGKVSRRLARMLEKGAIRNSDGTVSVLVKYKDEEGHAIADSLDRNGHGHVISERARVEVINANVEDIEKLAKNPHIEMVELDQEVHALPNMRANDVPLCFSSFSFSPKSSSKISSSSSSSFSLVDFLTRRGPEVGLPVGPKVGLPVGPEVGLPVGPEVGLPVGPEVGLPVGPEVGLPVGSWKHI